VTEVAFPFRVDTRGRTADATRPEHIRDLVEQLLFTAPGERVNRPSFGAGLLRMVHEPAYGDVGAAAGLLVEGALQETLGHLIEVEHVAARSQDSALVVEVTYALRATGERREERFRQEVT
jgi:uncharacterized protein